MLLVDPEDKGRTGLPQNSWEVAIQ